MSRKLNTTVHIHDAQGQTLHVFGPDDEVPADLAKLITNPKVWAETDAEGEPSEAWTVAQLKAYADEHSIDLGDATKKADILAAIELADDEPAV
jgi:hypothetical protein